MSRTMGRHYSLSVHRHSQRCELQRSRSLEPIDRRGDSFSRTGSGVSQSVPRGRQLLVLPNVARRQHGEVFQMSPPVWRRTPSVQTRPAHSLATPMSRTSSGGESCDATGRRFLPLATLRGVGKSWSAVVDEDGSQPSRSGALGSRLSGSISHSVASDGSRSSRSRASFVHKRLRPSKSACSGTEGFGITAFTASQPQVPAASHYSMDLDGPDFQIFATGLQKGSVLCSALDLLHLQSLAQKVQLYYFAPGEVAAKKDMASSHLYVVRDGFFVLEEGARLGPCCVFGELDLLQLHSEVFAGGAGGSCLGIAKCWLLEQLKQLRRQLTSQSRRLLRESDLFRYLDAANISRLSRKSCTVKHRRGDCVIPKGELSRGHVYLVKSGELVSRDANGWTTLLSVGDCLCHGCVTGIHASAVHADSEEVELLAMHYSSLQAALGVHAQDFLWRCVLLAALRDHWSSHTAFEELLTFRADPEALARACIIRTLTPDSELPPEECQSIHWYMLLDGHLTHDSHRMAPFEWQHCQGNVSLHAGSFCTLALLLKDAVSDPCESDESESPDKLRLVQQVFLFRNLDSTEQKLLAESSRLISRRAGETIYKEGDLASQSFVVVQGEVTQSQGGRLLRTLGGFSTFGEQALLSNQTRALTITCKTERASLLAIDKMVFEQVVKERVFAQLQFQLQLQRADIEMEDLRRVCTLGYGTFGVVQLVEHKASRARYALKCISRGEAEARQQQERIKAEREILADVDHPFILKLVRTFKDSRFVYILTEFVTGGELFNAIRSLGILSGSQARFYTGSLILALQALHAKKIVYRDLKPENVLLDNYGYIKLIDFGCAVRLDKGSHRSLVGTPHYMAPEVILGEAYSYSCDVWSLGVCLFEFVCGPLPFGQSSEDPKQVFQDILLSKLFFPEHFTNVSGKHLLRCLLRKNSRLRIGCGERGLQDVQEHSYFRKFSFVRLLGRNLEPPQVSSPHHAPPEEQQSESCELKPSVSSGPECDDWATDF
ncbi:unnamed protein product [Effrenium voratum]|uniref:cGMP-dependent protein kinase n=2 Tax=Effrenium voratum TaxID=2562239 RepID=A0AA36ND33_9DINO|nr:unnamed protein product [Effrenium voratum]CAJ1460856.1 unnamed protein product [Effrenium voratum]